jgi:hypothetical protein
LWPKLTKIDKFARETVVRTFPSGERRVSKDPPPEIVLKAFDELGTNNAVAAAFGVTRHVVARWVSLYGMNVTSRPEVRHSNFVRRCLAEQGDKIRVGQWIMDEGSVGVTYFKRTNYTSLLVCGSMNDFEALDLISRILQTPCNCSRSGRINTLPLLGVRMYSSKAYALLETVLPHMAGLKAMEARAALAFLPPTGMVSGKHTTDEFLTPVWREFALLSLKSWSARRRQKIEDDELEILAKEWVEGRIKRARRFVYAAVQPKGPVDPVQN